MPRPTFHAVIRNAPAIPGACTCDPTQEFTHSAQRRWDILDDAVTLIEKVYGKKLSELQLTFEEGK